MRTEQEKARLLWTAARVFRATLTTVEFAFVCAIQIVGWLMIGDSLFVWHFTPATGSGFEALFGVFVVTASGLAAGWLAADLEEMVKGRAS